MPLFSQQESSSEEVRAFVRHAMSKRIGWESSLRKAMIMPPANWILFLHLAICALHYAGGCTGTMSATPFFHLSKEQQPVVKQQQPDQKEEEPAMKISDLLASDPVTMLYDAASLLMKDRTTTQPACNCSYKPPIMQETKKDQEQQKMGLLLESFFLALPFATLCASMFSLLLLVSWSNSRQAQRSRSSCTNAGVVWQSFCGPLLFRVVMCSLTAWCICALIHMQISFKLALCAGMHSCCMIPAAMLVMVHECPLASPFMPRFLGNGVGMGLASMLLFVVPNVYHRIQFSVEEFYMHHCWAVLVVGQVIRTLQMFCFNEKFNQ